MATKIKKSPEVLSKAKPIEYVTPSLRRDFRGAANDNFTIILDTF